PTVPRHPIGRDPALSATVNPRHPPTPRPRSSPTSPTPPTRRGCAGPPRTWPRPVPWIEGGKGNSECWHTAVLHAATPPPRSQTAGGCWHLAGGWPTWIDCHVGYHRHWPGHRAPVRGHKWSRRCDRLADGIFPAWPPP